MRAVGCVAIGLVVLVVGCAAPARIAEHSPAAAASSPPTETTTEPTASATATAAPSTAPVAPLLVITSAVFHAGEVGIAYAPVALGATGGVPPYSWSISVGALPGGLMVATGGTVSGTPNAEGAFAFTVHVADTVGGSAIVNRSITILRYLAVSGGCTVMCSVEQGCVTVCGSFGSIGGGVVPYSYQVTAGALPPGMGLNGLTLTGPFPPEPLGAVSTPYKFQVTVTDSLGATGSVTAVFHVFPHIALQNATIFQGPGVAFTVSMPYSGGSGIPTASVVKGTLPPGSKWYLDTAKQMLVIQVPAQAAPPAPITYTMTFQLTDQSLCGPNPGELCSTTATASINIK